MNKFNIDDRVVDILKEIKGNVVAIEKRHTLNIGEYKIFYFLDDHKHPCLEDDLRLVEDDLEEKNNVCMESFSPSETSFIGEIKKQIEVYLNECVDFQIIDKDAKQKMIAHLGHNWYDERFDGKPFVENAVGCAMSRWHDSNFELVKLWKEVAVNSANITTNPHSVANETVKEFKKQFKLED